MFSPLRILHICLRVLLVLALTTALCLVGVAVFLYHNPQSLARHLADEVAARTGMTCTLESVSVALLPLPSLALSDVYMRSDAMELSVAYATVRPSLMPLLHGDFEPASVTLLRPQLRVRVDSAAQGPDLGSLEGVTLPDMLDGAAISISYGLLQVEGASSLLVEDIATDLRLHAPAMAQVELSGKARLDGRLLPFAVQGKIQGDGAGSVHFPHLALGLDQDRLVFTGTLALRGPSAPTPTDPTKDGLALAGPTLEGSLALGRLSLSQWFGFARQLPPGLQNALHRLEGRLDFHLDTRGLEVPHIEVLAAGARFVGRGSVPSWAAPVVLLDLRAPDLDLDAAFPETRGQNPTAPAFGHAPLTPEPGSPAAKALSGPDIGYDINLQVGSLQSWKLTLGEVGFRCAPAAQDQVGMSFAVGNMYGGKGEGSLLLRRMEQKTGYTLKTSLKNVALEPMLTPWVGPLLGGRLWLESEAATQGHTMASFLTGLDGSLALRLENGFVRSGGGKAEKLPFARVYLESRTRSSGDAAVVAAGRIPPELSFTGKWKGGVDAPQFKGAFQLEGPVTFSSTGMLPVQVRKAPGHVSVTVDKTLTGLAETLKADVTGRFSLHSGKRWLAVEDGQAELWGMILKGSAQAVLPDAKGQGASARGHLALTTANARRALHNLAPGTAAVFPQGTLQGAQGQADFQWSPGSMELARLKLRVDETTLSGAVSGQWKGRPQWKFELAADTLNMDRYLSPKTARAGAVSSPPARKNTPQWSLGWMKNMDADGSLRVGLLRAHKVSVREARTPVHLRAGTLSCPAVQGNLYGAQALGSFRAEAGQGLATQVSLEASNIDLQALCADRGMKTVLGGRGYVWLRAQGAPRSSAQIPGAFDGAWRVHASEAFVQARNDKGALTGKRTVLGKVQASGVLQKGVLRSETLTLAGPDITASGGGWVNLNTDTLDVRLQVNMYRIPEFPVRFYGSLSAPQRSINAGKAIIDTLGNLGTGVLDVVGDVVGGALRLF